ncbi:hypothetical protein [Texcoconibacillus texcoconensis]|uniref:Uncharacterized protein n=1 Tax=Texcoconibacillus texcoconensis TaxID=1095777 RepID=A0A840QU80_9BACI|nr:hypothetical protein [Texcoconibacillus texcoconensis]MBB5174863.1 hypothetical protein [Texcoconibacillus texcoconensis]
MSELEQLCIRVDKVYDWVTRQVDKDYSFSGDEGLERLGFSCNNNEEADGDNPCEFIDDDDEVFVTVVPTDADGDPIDLDEIECVEVGRRQDVYVEDFDTDLQLVKLKKQGFFVIELRLNENGDPFCVSEPISFCVFEKFLLCAPEGTEINCHIYDFDSTGVLCCNNGEFLDLELTLHICQSVQVEAEVKVEVEGKLCQPREDIIMPIEKVCPEITFPPQCPEVFPQNKC